jgi:hypothetical protein
MVPFPGIKSAWQTFGKIAADPKMVYGGPTTPRPTIYPFTNGFPCYLSLSTDTRNQSNRTFYAINASCASSQTHWYGSSRSGSPAVYACAVIRSLK